MPDSLSRRMVERLFVDGRIFGFMTFDEIILNNSGNSCGEMEYFCFGRRYEFVLTSILILSSVFAIA